jgi:hypothetical protein
MTEALLLIRNDPKQPVLLQHLYLSWNELLMLLTLDGVVSEYDKFYSRFHAAMPAELRDAVDDLAEHDRDGELKRWIVAQMANEIEPADEDEDVVDLRRHVYDRHSYYKELENWFDNRANHVLVVPYDSGTRMPTNYTLVKFTAQTVHNSMTMMVLELSRAGKLPDEMDQWGVTQHYAIDAAKVLPAKKADKKTGKAAKSRKRKPAGDDD